MSNRVARLALLVAATVGAWTWDWGQLGATSETAEKRPITFEDLEHMKRVSDPQISPSGKWVVFSAAEVDLDRNSMVNHLWVVPLGGTATPATSGARERQITFAKEGEFAGRLSPDGKMLLYMAKDQETGHLQVFVTPWDDTEGKSGTPKRLTNSVAEADGAVWSPDSQQILFTSRVYPECSDEAAWALEDACDRAKDEAAAANPMKSQLSNHPAYRRGDYDVGSKRSHLFVVSAANGDSIRDLTPRRYIGDADISASSPDGKIGYGWSPDSMEVAFVANLNNFSTASANSDVFTLKLSGQGARPERVSTFAGSKGMPAYSPDGKWLAFRSQASAAYGVGQLRLMLFDRRMGTTAEVLPKFDRSINELTWAPDSASIFFTADDRGESHVYSAAVTDENTIHYIAVPTGNLTLLVKGIKSEFSELQISNDGTWLVSTAMSIERPSEVFRTSLRMLADDSPETKKQRIGMKLAIVADKTTPPIDAAIAVSPEALTHFNDKLLARLALEKMDAFWFAGIDGTKVQGFLIRPSGFDPSRSYPVKFLINEDFHGAWSDIWSYRWNQELMAAAGYVVVMVNPRGSFGYGQAFIDAMKGDWGRKAYTDLMKGLDYVEQHYTFIDKARECALGGSFGGFMAQWVLTHTDRFACLVTHDGTITSETAYSPTGEQRRLNGLESPNEDRTSVQDESAAQDALLKSPMPSLRNAKTPTLVIQSQPDDRLDALEPPQSLRALQQLHVQSKVLYLPDEGHRLNHPQNSRLWYESVGDWCDRWTKTSRYTTGSPQTIATTTVAEPKKPQEKPQPVPSRSVAQSTTEPSKAQLASSLPPKPSVATTASTIPPAAMPAQSTPTQTAVTSPARTVPPSVHVESPPPMSTLIVPLSLPALPATARPQPSPQNVVRVVSGPMLAVPPPPMTQKAAQTVSQVTPQVVPTQVAPALQSNPQGSFVIAISSPANEIKAGEDARVSIVLTNVSDHPILFSHPPGADNPEFAFIFLVRNSAGHLMGENIATGPGASDLRAVDHIPPGGMVVQTAHLSRLVHLSQPGRYTVRVYRRDADNNQVVQSNEITLNIVASTPIR